MTLIGVEHWTTTSSTIKNRKDNKKEYVVINIIVSKSCLKRKIQLAEKQKRTNCR